MDLVRGIAAPGALAIHGDALYWTDGGGIFTASLTGSGVEVLGAGDAPRASMGFDDQNVYWTPSVHAVESISFSGGQRTTLVSGITVNTVTWRDLPVGDGHVYFPGDSEGETFRVPVTGGSAEHVTTATAGPLALTDAGIYFVNDTGLMRAAFDGTGPVHVNSLGPPRRLLVRGGYVFGATSDGIFRISLNGDSSIRVTPDSTWVMTADDATLYWNASSFSVQGIRKVPLGDTGGEFISGDGPYGELVVSALALYYFRGEAPGGPFTLVRLKPM